MRLTRSPCGACGGRSTLASMKTEAGYLLPRPVIELFCILSGGKRGAWLTPLRIYECIWADYGFAGMAHVATDRIDALRDSRVIVDSTSAPSHSKSVFSLEAYRSSSRMDAMMFAPQADLYFIDEGSDPWVALPHYD